MPTFVRRPQEVEVTRSAIRSWCGTTNQKLMVIDDGSPEKHAAQVEAICKPFPQVSFLRKDENTGFSATVNCGLRQAIMDQTDAVLVNSDIEFIATGWLPTMQANPAWVVGALLLYGNRVIQHAGIYFSVITRSFDHIFKYAPGGLPAAREPRICPVTGALQLIKLECLQEVGFYDEGFRLGWEDVSYCHDVFQHGQQCAYEPNAIAIHHESVFRGRNKTKQIMLWEADSWLYLMEKHKGLDFSGWCPTLIEEGCWE